MKKLLPMYTIVGTLVVGGGVFFATRQMAGSYLASGSQNVAAQTETAQCKKVGKLHSAVITNNQVTPQHTNAHLCDRLTITNNDDKLRDMAFGVHDRHTTYDGVSVKTLLKGQSLTVTLGQKGIYLFHDHYQDEVAGDFTVQ